MSSMPKAIMPWKDMPNKGIAKKASLERAIIWLMLAMLIISTVASAAQAKGIAPGHVDVTFEPGSEQKIKLKILNQDRQEFQAVLYAEGELAQYVTFDESIIPFTPDDTEKYAYYTLKLPASFEQQGLHTANIVARAVPISSKTGGTSMSANVAIISKLNVMVPYSGKYAEITLFSPNFEQGKASNFAVEVRNLGTDDILNAQLVIDIYSPTNTKLQTLTGDSFQLAAKQNKIVTLDWDPQLNSGNYLAVADLIYDSSNAKDQKPFTIGQFAIDIVDITVKDFKLGGIAMFGIMLENKWNEKIPGVYGQVSVKDESGKTYTEFKTASVDLNEYAKQPIQAYWDTKSVGPGRYKLGVNLNYLGKQSERVFDIVVSADRIDTNLGGMAVTENTKEKEPLLQGVYILTFAVIVLIIINIFVFLRKSKKGK
jgi:methionine-rich copper-binding protein CopC